MRRSTTRTCASSTKSRCVPHVIVCHSLAASIASSQGLIADRNLTLGDLIGTIKTFFSKIGNVSPSGSCASLNVLLLPRSDITDVRFKPAYNPYTEVCPAVLLNVLGSSSYCCSTHAAVDGDLRLLKRAQQVDRSRQLWYQICLASPCACRPAQTKFATNTMQAFSARRCFCRWVCLLTCASLRGACRSSGQPSKHLVLLRQHLKPRGGLLFLRPTMIKYGIKNIRDLFGHKVRSRFALPSSAGAC
jgi:hypothetical protein